MDKVLDKILGFGGSSKIIIPFTLDIINTNLPWEFKRPNAAVYDGKMDPRVFLLNFKYTMINQHYDTVHMCKIIPDFLPGDSND